MSAGLLPSKTRRESRRRAVRYHVEAALATIAVCAAVLVLFKVKPYTPAENVQQSKAYVLVGTAEMQLLDLTGPSTFSMPDASAGYSAFYQRMSPLRPVEIPPRNIPGRTLELHPLPALPPAPHAYADPILDWILMPRPETAIAPRAVTYPQVTLSNGGLITNLFSDSMSVRSAVALHRPSAPTVLQFIPSERAGMLPRIRLESSCGAVSLDQWARRELQSSANALGLNAPVTVTVVWRALPISRKNTEAR